MPVFGWPLVPSGQPPEPQCRWKPVAPAAANSHSESSTHKAPTRVSLRPALPPPYLRTAPTQGRGQVVRANSMGAAVGSQSECLQNHYSCASGLERHSGLPPSEATGVDARKGQICQGRLYCRMQLGTEPSTKCLCATYSLDAAFLQSRTNSEQPCTTLSGHARLAVADPCKTMSPLQHCAWFWRTFRSRFSTTVYYPAEAGSAQLCVVLQNFARPILH